ncbi:DUF3108 domain-containing protein [Ramlibacter alkalitolerans]
MKAAGAAPWRRLAPLAVMVLAVHLVLLRGLPPQLGPARLRPLAFATRSIAPPAPVPAPRPPPIASQQSPPRAPAARPAARPAAQRPNPPAAPRSAPAQPVPAPAPVSPPAPPAASASEASPAPAVSLPAPARLHYEVAVQKGPFALAGRALLDWRHDGQQYEARLEASGIVGSRVQRSTGRITPEGLAPAYFSDKARSEQATHFDRANGRLVFSNNRPDAPIEGGMQDRLSVIVQLSALVAGAPAKYRAGTQVLVPTASTREADTWIFSVEGEEELALPGGTVHALKLQRLPRREYDQKLELWLAPRMDYAPVRLRLTNPNGDTVDNRWSSTDKG